MRSFSVPADSLTAWSRWLQPTRAAAVTTAINVFFIMVPCWFSLFMNQLPCDPQKPQCGCHLFILSGELSNQASGKIQKALPSGINFLCCTPRIREFIHEIFEMFRRLAPGVSNRAGALACPTAFGPAQH